MLVLAQVTDGVRLVMAGVVITVGVILVMAMAMAGVTAMVGDGVIPDMVTTHPIILVIIRHTILVITKEQLMENAMPVTQVE